MVDSFLTGPEKEVFDYVAKFASEEVRPLARQIDEKMEVPKILIDRMKELGLFATYIPEKYGGAGLSFRFLIRAMRILGTSIFSSICLARGLTSSLANLAT